MLCLTPKSGRDVCMHACVSACVYVCMCAYARMHAQAGRDVSVCMCVCVCVCMCVRVHAQAFQKHLGSTDAVPYPYVTCVPNPYVVYLYVVHPYVVYLTHTSLVYSYVFVCTCGCKRAIKHNAGSICE